MEGLDKMMFQIIFSNPGRIGVAWITVTLALAYLPTSWIVTVLRRLALVVVAVLPPFLLYNINYNDKIKGWFWARNEMRGWIRSSPVEMLDHVLVTATKGDASNIAEVIDQYCWKVPMMNLGDVKGPIVDEAIRKRLPKVMVELGAFVGYSSVRFGAVLKDIPGAKLYSVDPSPLGHAVQAKLLQFAGLQDVVEPIYGYSGDVLKKMAKDNVTIDLLFLDHVKELYLPDLQLIISLGLLKPGSIVVADNVLFPGCPEYKQFVIDSPLFVTKVHETFLEYSTTIRDEVVISEYV